MKRPDSSQSVLKPELPATEELQPFQGPAKNQETYVRAHLDAITLSETRVADVEFEASLFYRVTAQAMRWSNPHFSDCKFDVCDLANAQLLKASLVRVIWRACRITGIQVSESRFHHALISECKANLASFQGSTFRGSRFERCDLSSADFHRADLRNVVFSDCDLRGARFTDAQLVGTDFRGCRITGISVAADDLKGAIVDPLQAAEVAELFGLRVERLNE